MVVGFDALSLYNFLFLIEQHIVDDRIHSVLFTV